MSVVFATLCVSAFRICRHRLSLRMAILTIMNIQDESLEEINEALSHIVEVLHKTRDSQKKHLWAMVDELLDAKIAMENK